LIVADPFTWYQSYGLDFTASSYLFAPREHSEVNASFRPGQRSTCPDGKGDAERRIALQRNINTRLLPVFIRFPPIAICSSFSPPQCFLFVPFEAGWGRPPVFSCLICVKWPYRPVFISFPPPNLSAIKNGPPFARGRKTGRVIPPFCVRQAREAPPSLSSL
jgi:hypothetical protein